MCAHARKIAARRGRFTGRPSANKGVPAISKFPWKTAWVVGASSGIGRQLAIDLADAGVEVAASARSKDALDQLAAAHPNIVSVPLDITDRDAVKASPAVTGEAVGDIDVAILCAGVWHPDKAIDIDGAKAAQSMAVNYVGNVNCIEALLPGMRARGRGHIALTGSVAGYRGLPKACHYGPTKAALINLAETLCIELKPHGIAVTIINPGFVDTPMTEDNDFEMPYLMTPEEAARKILDKLPGQPFEIAFPWQLVTMLKTAEMMPTPLYLWQTRRSLGFDKADD